MNPDRPDQDGPVPQDLTDEQLLAEIRGATSYIDGWKAHHAHLTVLAVERGIPVKDVARVAGLTPNGVRYRVKLAQLPLGET